MTRIRLIKHCLAWRAGAFVGLAGYIVVLINHHQAEISQLSNYNLAWVASQATVEISRFQQRITSFRAHIDDVDEDEVGLRFDSRQPLGDVGRWSISRVPGGRPIATETGR